MSESLTVIPRTERQPSPTMRDLLAVIFRQRRMALITFVATFLVVVIYGLVAPPYRSEMKVLLRHSRVDPVVTSTPSQAEFERAGITEEEVNSEAELLQDDEILRTVVQNARLTSEGRSWFWSLFGDSDEKRLARAARRIGKRLTVEPAHKAALITVSYQWSDPEQGAKVLRALAAAYAERHHQVHHPSSAFSFFDQQVTQSRRGLEAAELQVMEFTRNQDVISAAQERDFALQQLSETEADVRKTGVALKQNSGRLQALQLKLTSLPARATTLIRNTDNPELLEKLKDRLLELELKRTELLTQYEPTYRLVQEADEEIAQTKSAIAAEDQLPIRDQTSDLEPNHEWAKSELLKAQIESNTLQAHARAETALATHYRQLAHRLGERAIEEAHLLNDLKAAEEKYLLYVNKREEARIGDALDEDGILNVAIAEQPSVPALPERSELGFGLIGLALAATVSTGFAFANDYLNPGFRTPDEITAYLGAPVLASLPAKSLVDAEAFSQSRLK